MMNQHTVYTVVWLTGVRYMNNITIGIHSNPYGKFLWISDHDAEMVTDFTLEEAKAFCAHMADKIIELEQM